MTSAANVPEYGPGAALIGGTLGVVLLCVLTHYAARAWRTIRGGASDYQRGHDRGYERARDEHYARGWNDGYEFGHTVGMAAGERRMARANGRAQLNLPRHAVGAFRGFGGRLGRQLRDTHHPPAPPPGFNDSEGDETL